ncbi:early nodulin-like protein 2 [Dioscorea cayenensis subsp. rotundata]|uniref:Early nodulin-like protein 2 n=1 Tax=Dioscorea cayennensis subsp. rotundata TaxID=55577 RepID=A0AB40AL49_DIOCR|nr:early nodulin-like protein 2 [Dioscorea cayenensis subsp. rotundata]
MDTVKAFAWLLFMLQIMSCSLAYEFQVGGKDGWILNPHESYSQWSGRNRFQVHDKLVFKYKKEEDSVLVVSKEDYDKCNVSNPIKKFDDGNSVFEFDKTGPFFFISGASGKCNQGQKLSVIVLSLKTKKPSTSPAPSPTSSVPSPPPSSSSSPPPPPSSSSSPPSQSPSSAASSPSSSPSSAASSPSSSSSPEASPTPSISISPSATTGSPVSSQSPSPSSGASSGVPSSLSPGQSSGATNAASSPGSSPAGPQSPAPALAATWMSFGWVTLVFCGLFLG